MLRRVSSGQLVALSGLRILIHYHGRNFPDGLIAGDAKVRAAALHPLVDGRSFYKYTPAIVEIVLRHGLNFRIYNEIAHICCAAKGNIEGVRLSLKHGAETSLNALLSACENGSVDVVLLLIQCGVKPFKFCLVRAAEKGHARVVEILLDAGLDPEGKDNIFEYGHDWADDPIDEPPLALAARKGHESVVQLLLDRGVHIDWRVVEEAVEKRHSSIVRRLVERGVSKHALNVALVRAVLHGDEILSRVLLDHGANPRAVQNNVFPGPLSAGDLGCLRLLHQQGVNLQVSFGPD